MEKLKNRFKEWMIKSGKNGKTPSNYISSLNTVNRKISCLDDSINFFEYSFSEVGNIINLIRESSEYKEINATSNNSLSAALAQYEKFIEYERMSDDTYLSIKISNAESKGIVKSIENCSKLIEIDQLNQLKENIKLGQYVLMVCSGDKVEWDKGLKGIAKVSKLPYDFVGKNFKLRIDMLCSFKTISRKEFIPYIGTYDAADIGPSTKGSQNQALKQITFDQFASIIRAIFELRPEVQHNLLSVIEKEILEVALGMQGILHLTYSTHREKCNDIGYNKIYYGIPGCGKSHHIEHVVLNGINKDSVFRTTFYLDYSNSDFIGQIYPKVVNGNVEYVHVPGPFTRALAKAYSNPSEMVYLVIEEINRGNAAAIFGDTFQLLDRLKKDYDGRYVGDSEYPISNTFIEDYFELQGIQYTKGQIYIPRNLTILATMNTSDQNVFPLDTAFKRRWERERVPGDWNKCTFKDKYIPYTDITWKNFATSMNVTMVSKGKEFAITEDKQMGPWFANEDMLTDSANEPNDEKILKFVNNVIDYLFNDVTKFEHTVLFDNGIESFEDIDKFITKVKNPEEAKKFIELFTKDLEL